MEWQMDRMLEDLDREHEAMLNMDESDYVIMMKGKSTKALKKKLEEEEHLDPDSDDIPF